MDFEGKDELKKDVEKRKLTKMVNHPAEFASTYPPEYEMLDACLDEILDMLYDIKKYKEIAKLFGIRPLIFAKWTRESNKVMEIKEALELSSETYMQAGLETLDEGLNDPNPNVALTGLYREKALYLSRLAGFKSPRTYGKNADEGNTQPIIQIVNPENWQKLLGDMLQAKQISEAQEVDDDGNDVS